VNVSINTLSDVQQEADILLTHDELVPYFETAYAKYRPKVELRGFRKGKVPMPMIKKLYGEAIEREALDDIADEFYRKAMQEHNIQPLGRPEMVDMDFQRGQHFSFRIKYDVRPPIALKEYRGLKIEKQVHRVSDTEIEEEIGHIRRANASMTEVDRVTDEEHVVTADVQELDEAGTPLVGRKQTGMRITLSEPSLVAEIRAALQAAEKGQTYHARYETKHEDHAHTMSVAITVTKIEKIALPPFDEELVKKITGGKVSSPDEFLSTMRTDLERYWNDRAQRKLHDDIANELVRMHEFPVPESMVEMVLDSFIQELKERGRDGKLPAGFDEKKYREERRVYAVWQAKWMLLREGIAEREKITVSDEDLRQEAERDAPAMNVPAEKLFQYYSSSGRVRERLLSDKLLQFLTEQAKITEKEVS
jgi:trigger factor